MTDAANAYFGTRLSYDRKREVLWRTLVAKVFQPMVGPSDAVVELGAGWCDFINGISARRKVAVDVWSGVVDQADPDVEAHVGPAEDLSFLADSSIDLVFASNLVEHLTREQVDALTAEAMRVLVPGGRLALLQPNYRLCSKRYFDDYTHVSVWSDVGLATYLEAVGWQVERVEGRFLPLTVKSRLPTSAALISAYLRSPVKPLAGQMLVVARTPED